MNIESWLFKKIIGPLLIEYTAPFVISALILVLSGFQAIWFCLGIYCCAFIMVARDYIRQKLLKKFMDEMNEDFMNHLKTFKSPTHIVPEDEGKPPYIH